MKQVFLFILLAATISAPSANGQGFSWAQAINGSNTTTSGTGVYTGTTDMAGNLYSVGWFSGAADFDAGPGISNLTAVSKLDMFIMKEDASGNLIWVKQVKGLSSGVDGCFGRAVDVDQNGNVFITGFTKDSFDFDPGPAVHRLSFLGSFGGNYYTFILKLDSSGNFVWVGSIGYQGYYAIDIQATTAKLDKNGNLYLAATYTGHSVNIDVDPGPGVNSIYLEVGDMLMEKIDNNGNLIWANRIEGSGVTSISRSAASLAFDSSCNVFVSGWFNAETDFDGKPATYYVLKPCGSGKSVFVAKYDSAGNIFWVKCFGSTSAIEEKGGGVDRFGNVLVTGSFGGTVDFDPGLSVYNLTANSAKSLFTLKLKNNGDLSWVRMVSPTVGLFSGGGVTTDRAGNVYTAVEGNTSCDLDPGAGVFNVSSGVAVQMLDSSGNFVWGAGWQADVPRWIGLDNKDSIYVAGSFTGVNKDFNPGPDTFLLSGNSNGSGFIIKLKQTPVATGINETSLQTDMRVYPNPSSGIVTFSSKFAIRRIKVTDIAGKVVYANEPAQAKTVIDLGGNATGVYFYEVDCGAGKQRGKLMVY